MNARVVMMMFVMIVIVMMMVILDESVGVVHLRCIEELVVELSLMMSVVMFVVEPEHFIDKMSLD